MRGKLGFKIQVSIDGAPPIPFESIPPDELARIRKIWAERFGNAVNEHLAQHPDEAERLLGGC